MSDLLPILQEFEDGMNAAASTLSLPIHARCKAIIQEIISRGVSVDRVEMSMGSMSVELSGIPWSEEERTDSGYDIGDGPDADWLDYYFKRSQTVGAHRNQERGRIDIPAGVEDLMIELITLLGHLLDDYRAVEFNYPPR